MKTADEKSGAAGRSCREQWLSRRIAGYGRADAGGIGEDPKRNGLLKTPERVAKALKFMTAGYTRTLIHCSTALCSPLNTMRWLSSRILIFSACANITCSPSLANATSAIFRIKKVVGLSKIPRLVDTFSRRLQVQERLTVQIAETLKQKLNANGVAVVMEARHLCMMMRGVEKQNTLAVTSSMLGVFRNQLQTREEFLKLINHS